MDGTKRETSYSSGQDRAVLTKKVVVRSNGFESLTLPIERIVFIDPTADESDPGDKEKILRTTWTYYDNPTSDGAAFGKVKLEVRPDGSWTRYTYNTTTGETTKQVRSFLEAAPTSTDQENVVTEYSTLSGITSIAGVGTDYPWWGVPQSGGTVTVGLARKTTVKHPRLNGSSWVSELVQCDYEVELVEIVPTPSIRSAVWSIRCAEPASISSDSAFIRDVLKANNKIPYEGLNIVTVTERSKVGTEWKTTKSLGSDGKLSTYQEDSTSTTVKAGFPSGSDLSTFLYYTKSVSSYNSTTRMNTNTTSETRWNGLAMVEVTTAQSVESNPDALGRAQTITYLDGTTETMTYDCCGLASRTDRDGNTTHYTRDLLGRTKSEARTLPNGNTLSTLYEYDAEGRTTKVTRESNAMGGGAAITDLTAYDLAGRVTESVSNGVRTTYTYEREWSTDTTPRVLSSKVTTKNPDYSTTNSAWEMTYPDGRGKETGGSMSAPTRQEYRVEDIDPSTPVVPRLVTRTIRVGSATPTPETTEWTEAVQDALGRTESTRVPDGSSGYYEAKNYYGARGRLVKQEDFDGVRTLFRDGWDNDAHVEFTETAIDLDSNLTNGTDNRNGTIDVGTSIAPGYDRVTRTERSIADAGSGVYAHRSVTKQVKDAAGAWETLSTTDQFIVTSGRMEKTVQYRGDASSGLAQTTITTHQPDAPLSPHDPTPNTSKTVVTNADGTRTETITFRGMTQSEHTLDSTTPTAVEKLKRDYVYDDHGRVLTVTELDPTGGSAHPVTTYAYEAFASGSNPSADRVASITQSPVTNGVSPSGSQVTSFEYDELGRQKKVYLPDHTSGSPKVVTTTFDAAGRAATVRGSAGARTQPVDYTYDNQGRMLTLTTYQGESGGGGSTLTGAATTKWIYNPYRGWLDEKQYADASTGSAAANSGPKYTYTHGGKPATRKWKREVTSGTPVTTTYTYNEAGDLWRTQYNDTVTPTMYFGYDRRGRTDLVTDQAGTRQFTYDGFDRLTKEEFTDGIFDTLRQDQTYSTVGQRTNLDYRQQSGSTTIELSNRGFGYDSLSRPIRFWTLAKPSSSWQSQFDAIYTYEPKGTRVASHTIRNLGAVSLSTHESVPGTGSSSDVAVAARAYDGLGRLTALQWGAYVGVCAGGYLESYSYAYNGANQRTSQTVTSYQTGTASWDRPDHRWDFTYDGYGQLTGANKVWTATSGNASGQNFGYAFDAIGNRTSATMGGSSPYATWTYMVDRLNRYTQRTVPRAFDFMGFSTNDPAFVKLPAETSPGVTATKEPVFSSSTGPFFRRLVSTFGAGEHAGTATGANSIPFFVPSSPEAYTYDDDGNLASDGRCIYTYDGENRLMTVELKSSLAGLSPIAFEGKWYYEYDYLGRRVRKYRKVGTIIEEQMMMSNMSGGEGGGETNSEGGETGGTILDESRFMYDGWLLTMELAGNKTLTRSYVWGLDLSGSMQGAGGIGGLLFQQNGSGTPTTSNTKWFSHDPQGNVTNLRNLTDDDRWAAVEYGPFGERLTGAGNLDQFKLRFSSKYFDEETGFNYFGYRYYNASTGRWINQDPSGEKHGPLYCIVRNHPTGAVDPLGLRQRATACGGRCGANIDTWFVDELKSQIAGWRMFSTNWSQSKKNSNLSNWDAYLDDKPSFDDYLNWTLRNQDYKESASFTFNAGTNCGTKTSTTAPGCGNSVTLCGACMRSATLGNIMYGFMAAHAGFERDLILATPGQYKNFWNNIPLLPKHPVDPYDQHAYELGINLFDGLDQGAISPNQPSLCQSIRQLIGSAQVALRESNQSGGYNHLAECEPCEAVTHETRHGGNR